MKTFADLLSALSTLAWPLLAGLVIWRLFPTIKKIIDSRGFTVKVGSAELTVQEVSEKVLKATADIQGKLASVSASPEYAGMESRSVLGPLRRVLWVDDHPSNNAFEAAQLQALGVDVVQVESTDKGIDALSASAPPFDAVISNMARKEDGSLHPDAGTELAREIRARGYDVPVFIYASDQTLAKRAEILAAGVNEITTSPTHLFTLLRKVGEFPHEYATGQ
ncbi:response regulator [Streptomyces sp. NRRL S-1448]|uniref:response regulator n=1 Tax=Streptomyces sp. NRRL S-1448 TaxID=1463883 RepID=UPI0004C1294E|nr:response regulator [Streptomyces sp. NRRL S-1448]